MRHCVETIQAIIAENRSDPRSIFQLGYNLGRLSELSGLGREPFWDRWKAAVSLWDLPVLQVLAQELHRYVDEDAPTLSYDSPPAN